MSNDARIALLLGILFGIALAMWIGYLLPHIRITIV